MLTGSRPISVFSSRLTSATIAARLSVVHRGRLRVGRTAGGPERRLGVLPPEHAELGAQRGDLLAFAVGGLARRQKTAEAEEEDGREGDDERRNETAKDIDFSKFGSCHFVPAGARSYSFAVPGAPERLYRLEQARLAGMYRE